jgi:hypothetical protein
MSHRELPLWAPSAQPELPPSAPGNRGFDNEKLERNCTVLSQNKFSIQTSTILPACLFADMLHKKGWNSVKATWSACGSCLKDDSPHTAYSLIINEHTF